ncbi:MAG: SPOR domain-containing protein [Candidatus Omnitrophica bacterium]|nr:SPOR domain-containing protein [Candidatus Omnitrophota bacterium]
MTLALTTAFAADDLHSLQELFLRGEYAAVVEKTKGLLPRARYDRDGLLYLQGLSALKLKETELARSSLEELMTRYPQSPFSSQAKLAVSQVQTPSDEPVLFSVQVGAFQTRANAVKLAEELKRRGYDADVSEAQMHGKRFFRVRVGQYADRPQAESKARDLAQEGFPTKIVP